MDDSGTGRTDMTTSTPAQRQMRETTVDEALSLLATQELGRLIFTHDDRPRVLPLNFAVHQGAVVFRTSYGDLLDHVHLTEVLFEVDHAEPATQTGWSVIVTGRAEEIWRTDELARVRELQLRPWAPGERDHFVRIVSTRITGRVIE
jgi:nitroimidazol reductase NimA-like FMN-containing flavoprotein (pyridoxamine 5'-phosphate oxidase superfamily)